VTAQHTISRQIEAGLRTRNSGATDPYVVWKVCDRAEAVTSALGSCAPRPFPASRAAGSVSSGRSGHLCFPFRSRPVLPPRKQPQEIRPNFLSVYRSALCPKHDHPNAERHGANTDRALCIAAAATLFRRRSAGIAKGQRQKQREHRLAGASATVKAATSGMTRIHHTTPTEAEPRSPWRKNLYQAQPGSAASGRTIPDLQAQRPTPANRASFRLKRQIKLRARKDSGATLSDARSRNAAEAKRPGGNHNDLSRGAAPLNAPHRPSVAGSTKAPQ